MRVCPPVFFHLRPSLVVRRCLALAFAAGIAGCATDPPVAVADGNTAEARRQLLERSSEETVPMLLVNPPAEIPSAELARFASEGVRGFRPSFVATAEAPAGPHLVLAFAADPGTSARTLCMAPRPADRPGDPEGIFAAAWCEGEQPIAMVTAQPEMQGQAAVERLVWRSTGRLFPDDYASTYGLGVFGNAVGVGAGIGIGSGLGLGGGLSF